MLDARIADRIGQLIHIGEELEQHVYRPGQGNDRFNRAGNPLLVKDQDAAQWGVSCLTLLSKFDHSGQNHLKYFQEAYTRFPAYIAVLQGLGVLRAAEDDFKQGMLFDTRTLIEAEVFDDFLEQADYLLQSGYYQPAAVVAGAVLEDGLRKLCDRNNIALPDNPKAETMNAELKRANVYNMLVQKQITALTDLRNKAAHGQWDQFTKEQVATMLPQVRDFMVTHFS